MFEPRSDHSRSCSASRARRPKVLVPQVSVSSENKRQQVLVVDMLKVKWLVTCASLFTVVSDCIKVIDRGGHEFLENILRYYGKNESITTENLEDFLLLISARRSVTEGTPLEDQECPSAEQILSHFGLRNVTELSVEHLGRICPAVLTQVLLPSCPFTSPSTVITLDYSVWGYGFLAVTVINLASLLGLLLIPFTKKPYFPKVLTYFIGLAIGTLFSNAVLQLIPEALGFDPKADNYVANAVGIFGGFYLLFVVEKILKMSLGIDHEHGHSHFNPAELPQENYVQNGDMWGKKDSVVLTSIATITTDNSSLNLEPPQTNVTASQDIQVSGVMCHWLRGQRITNIRTVAWMITLSDALHNFIDGLAIGASFTVSILTGFSTSTAIVCEEFPHELGDFVILLNAGMSIPQAIFFNLLSSMSCYIGLVLGILLGSNFAPNAIFAIAGGMFLYIALADMFPEMDSIAREQKRTSSRIIIFLIQNAGLLTGFTIILLITLFAGDINLG